MQEIFVHLPPGAPPADGDQIRIELRTDSRDPAFEKIEVPVQIVGAPMGTPAPRAAPTTRRTPTPTVAPAPDAP